MAEENTLPEHWQELPQVKKLLEDTLRESRGSLSAITRERDTLKSELQQLKQELEKMREETTAQKTPPEKNPAAGPADQQERQRLENLARQMQERIKTLEAELQAKDRRLAEEVLERGIRDAVTKVGQVHKDAWPDVVARGKRLFSLNEQGQPVARDESGNVVYGDDPLKPLGFEEWATKLLSSAPHLFKASGNAGSGASGGAGQEQEKTTVRLTKDEARNPITYRRAKERATKLGTELVIQ